MNIGKIAEKVKSKVNKIRANKYVNATEKGIRKYLQVTGKVNNTLKVPGDIAKIGLAVGLTGLLLREGLKNRGTVVDPVITNVRSGTIDLTKLK